MTYWILPWNKEVYNLPQCLIDFGYVEWRQQNKLAVNDIVFLYCSSPVRQIKYMMRVSKVNIPFLDSINDEYLFNYGYKLKETDLYSRFELIAKTSEPNPELSYRRLRELGLTSQLQGGIKVPNNLLSHILENFDVIFDDLTHSYTEGTAHNISITTYERNEQARNICLTHFGYNCQICGLNFEEKYGSIGKDFIHVHHIKFISSMQGQTHDINPLTDLIPVCPNCHSMLHRKVEGVYLTPYQLKERLSNV